MKKTAVFFVFTLITALVLSLCQTPLVYAAPNSVPAPEEEAVTMTVLVADLGGFNSIDSDRYILNGLLYVKLESFPPVSKKMYTPKTMEKRIRALETDKIRNVKVVFSDEHTKWLTHPAWLVTYQKGWNEDTAVCTDLYFKTETGEYRVHISISADCADEYSDRIKKVLESVALVDNYCDC
jgi:hypothetical protein